MVKKRRANKTCLLYGEGGREKIFFNFLIKSRKFKSEFPQWVVSVDNACGQSCGDVLKKCINITSEREYDLVLCFIDTDKLYEDFPRGHKKVKGQLEKKASKYNINIVWQEKNHEDELCRATGGKVCSKPGMKGRLKKHSDCVLRSGFTKNIFKKFRDLS